MGWLKPEDHVFEDCLDYSSCAFAEGYFKGWNVACRILEDGRTIPDDRRRCAEAHARDIYEWEWVDGFVQGMSHAESEGQAKFDRIRQGLSKWAERSTATENRVLPADEPQGALQTNTDKTECQLPDSNKPEERLETVVDPKDDLLEDWDHLPECKSAVDLDLEDWVTID